jgi:TonB family protein
MKLITRCAFPLLGLALAMLPARLSAQTPAKGDPVYDVASVDKKPELRRRVRPSYPASLRRDPPSEITLRFVVTPEGRVTNIAIMKFSDPDMIDAAHEAYENARFTPGEIGGKPVHTRMEVTDIYPAPKETKK